MSLNALVAWPDDKLAGAVAHELSQRGQSWRWLVPSTLAGLRASISDSVLRLDGELVDAVLWRVAPEADLSVDFAANDRVFADTEARSFWLAALNLDAVRSTIRPAAELFFARSGWSYWREVLRRRSVRLASLRFGADVSLAGAASAAWLPYGSATLRPVPSAAAVDLLGAATTQLNAALRVHFAGTVLSGAEGLLMQARAELGKAARVLNDDGLYLGDMLVSDDGAILAVDAFPRIEHPATVRRLLPATLEVLNDSSDRR